MLKNTILNNELIYILSRLGHTQTICICDAGLPIPLNSKLVDLALLPGYPDIHTVINAILDSMPTEKAYCAHESIEKNPDFIHTLRSKLDYDISFVSHDELKELSHNCIAFIRTGECTPYANIILQATTTF